ncbi:MAG: hypothetical protein R3B12_00655 [Candidatus Saccharimonadales bacterium]
MSERNKRDFLGLPWDAKSFNITEKAESTLGKLRSFIVEQAGVVTDTAKTATDTVVDKATATTSAVQERSKNAYTTVSDLGSSAVESVFGRMQAITADLKVRLLGDDEPSLGDRPERGEK